MRMHVILLSLVSETCAGKRASSGKPGDSRVTQAGCKWVNTLYVTMLVNVNLGVTQHYGKQRGWPGRIPWCLSYRLERFRFF
jgi:hypothetical protein